METAATLVTQLRDVLREAIEGPPNKWSYFTSNNPDGGLLGTIGGLTAPQVSKVLGSASVASHVYHVIFGMRASSAWLGGNRVKYDWSESWTVTEVSEAEWKDLIVQLEDQYATLSRSIASFALTDSIAAGVAFGAVAHVAYHLGAIQQKLELLQPG